VSTQDLPSATDFTLNQLRLLAITNSTEGVLNNRHLFLTRLEARKSKAKELANLMIGGGLQACRSYLFAVCLLNI
jgi:hypothetical protein